MANCLVEKLKESIDKNLPKFNAIRIISHDAGGDYGNAQRRFFVRAGKSCKIVCRGGISGLSTTNPYTNLQQELTLNVGTSTIFLADEDFICDVDDKSAVEYIGSSNTTGLKSFFSIYLDDLSYLTNADTLLMQEVDLIGSIESLMSLPKLSTLNVYKTPATGEINTLAAGLAPSKADGTTLTITCNDYITLDGVVVGNGVVKTITFDGDGGYSVS